MIINLYYLHNSLKEKNIILISENKFKKTEKIINEFKIQEDKFFLEELDKLKKQKKRPYRDSNSD